MNTKYELKAQRTYNKQMFQPAFIKGLTDVDILCGTVGTRE